MKKGFTLIELLIVIAIIGILAGILFVSVGQKPIRSARDAKRTSDLQNLRSALTLFYTDSNQYPSALTSLVPTYIPNLATDPRDNATGCGDTTYTPNFPGTGYTAGDYGYRYAVSSTNQGYVLQTCLEDNTNPSLASDCDSTTADPACSTNAFIYDLHS